MKNILFTFIICFSAVHTAQSQKNFKEKYEAFRFNFHSQLKQAEPLKISRGMGDSMQKFLMDHTKQILNFRKSQLKEYQRKSLEEAAAYTALTDSAMKKIRDQMILLGVDNAMSQISDSRIGEYEAIDAMLKLLSVDPIFMIQMMSSQIMPTILVDYMDLQLEEMRDVFARIGIGGTYLSTREVDKTNWIITINNYYLIYQFSNDIETGKMELLSIKTRNLETK